MVTTEIIPAELWHAEHIAANIREPDRAEIWAASYQTPLRALSQAIEQSDYSAVGTIDGEPVLMWGVLCESFIGRLGVPWMIGTKMLDNNAFVFLRRCRAPLMKVLNNYDRLENYVDVRNTKSISWLRWMGFKIEESQPYGSLGMPFHRFWMNGGKSCVRLQHLQ